MNRRLVTLVLVVAVMVVAAPVWAEGDVTPAKQLVTAEPFDMTGSFFRMVGGLLFCLGIFAGGIHLVKRYGGGVKPGAKRRLQVLERIALTQKSSLILVSVDGKELLVSAGPDKAQLIYTPGNIEKDFELSLDKYALPEAKEKTACVG